MPEDVYTDALDRASGELRWLLRVLATSGIRRGECAQLHSDDVARRAFRDLRKNISPCIG